MLDLPAKGSRIRILFVKGSVVRVGETHDVRRLRKVKEVGKRREEGGTEGEGEKDFSGDYSNDSQSQSHILYPVHTSIGEIIMYRLVKSIVDPSTL